jgi:hypothetical protein
MQVVLKGVTIRYRLATPVALSKATVAAKDAGTWLGDIGNEQHQWNGGDPNGGRRHGDHTAWSSDGPAGVVKAFDWHPDNLARFRTWWLTQLRAGRYAAAVKFSNLAGRQYGPRGQLNGRSDDAHFHCSFAPGAATKKVDVIADYLADVAKGTPKPAPKPQEDQMDEAQERQLVACAAMVEDIYDMLLDGTSPTGNQTTDGGKPRVKLYRELAEVKAAQAAEVTRDAAQKAVLDAIVAATGGSGDLDTAQIVAAMRAEAEKTRAAIVAAAQADLKAFGDAIAHAGE